jgi:hypothetical protein
MASGSECFIKAFKFWFQEEAVTGWCRFEGEDEVMPLGSLARRVWQPDAPPSGGGGGLHCLCSELEERLSGLLGHKAKWAKNFAVKNRRKTNGVSLGTGPNTEKV